MSESTVPIRFKRLRIVGLFGPKSQTIDIPFRVEKRMTVLHGRNGSGKTITLEMIDALRGGRYRELLRYPFTRLDLELTDGSCLQLGQREMEYEENYFVNGLHYHLKRPGYEDEEGDFFSDEPFLENEFEQVGPDVWQNEQGMLFTYDELSVEPDSLKRLRKLLPPIKFIRTDRLFLRKHGEAAVRFSQNRGGFPLRRPVEEPPRLMVEHLSQKIRQLVRKADSRYRRISTRLDASLAQRLFKPVKNVPDSNELQIRSQELRANEIQLQEIGLLRELPLVVNEAALSKDQRSTFYIILQDREQKLASFLELAEKSERLIKSLNRKLAPKTVRLDVEAGYQILTEFGEPLALEQLSSGEQHELVLLHELLFDVEPGTLILIDEPELSLHVTWQTDMLAELLEIAQLSNLDFVLATHSPYIIGDHADLMVSLGTAP